MKENIENIIEKYRDLNKSGIIRIINKSEVYKKDLVDFLHNNGFKSTKNIAQDLYNYYNNIKDIPKCEFCNNNLKFLTYTKGYLGSCGSKECNLKSRQRNINLHRSKSGNYDNVGRKRKINLSYSNLELLEEFNFFLTERGSLIYPIRNNKIIKMFQQDTFFKKEKELLKNRKILRKLYENRSKFLKKPESEITNEELLTGFKKSGIYYGYSHFSPLWFKWFIENYNIKTCYDPCGGWGHRLLGAQNLKKYIYNDLSKSTKDNVDKIIKFFNIKNTITYNCDCRTFYNNDIELCEAWFTCPPYVTKSGNNIEHYECGDYSYDEYKSLLKALIELWKKSNAKYFGIVLREDLSNNIPYNDVFDLRTNNTNYLPSINSNKYKEKLYICKKDY